MFNRSPRQLSRILRYSNDFHHFWQAGINLIFPPKCLLCRSFDRLFVVPTLCQPCWLSLYEPSQLPIPDIQSSFIEAFACGTYNRFMQELITRAKFHCDASCFYPLEYSLNNLYSQFITEPVDIITNIPGVSTRIRKRGVHLSGYLARKLAKFTKAKYQGNILQRLRSTKEQTTLSRKERLTNIEGVFSVQINHNQKSDHILVVDDVFTTGATAKSVLLALQNAGLKKLSFLALARTLEP